MQQAAGQGVRTEAMQLKAQREEELAKRTAERHAILVAQMQEREAQVRTVQVRKQELIEQDKILRQIKNQSRREKAEQQRRANLCVCCVFRLCFRSFFVSPASSVCCFLWCSFRLHVARLFFSSFCFLSFFFFLAIYLRPCFARCAGSNRKRRSIHAQERRSNYD